VRELENTMHRVLILTQGGTVSAETIRLCLPHWNPEAAIGCRRTGNICRFCG
jgi:hypothetical protein